MLPKPPEIEPNMQKKAYWIYLLVALAITAAATLIVVTKTTQSEDKPVVMKDWTSVGDSTPAEEAYQPIYQDIPKHVLPVYIFGIHPLHNPQRLNAMYQPLIHHLNVSLSNGRLELEASRNYNAFDDRLRARHYHFALANPGQALNATEANYRIVGKLGDDDDFRGVILVRNESDIRKIEDLRGKTLAYPASSAMASTMMPQMFLQMNGLDVHKDIKTVYVGSIESTIMSVYRGDSAAAGVWLSAWRLFSREQSEIAGQLVARWRTLPLINYAVIARDDVPETVVRQVMDMLVSLKDAPEGINILKKIGVSHFERADISTYQPIREFISQYRAYIGTAPE
ncbi:phosphonate transport system substrate-binding protein [Azospirillaceae bacterium]